MGWIYSEPFWLFCPDFADVLIECQAFEGFEAAGVIVGIHEIAEVAAQLVVVVIIIALDSRVLDRPVHALTLSIGPCTARQVIACNHREASFQPSHAILHRRT